jgi:hypothetical protein
MVSLLVRGDDRSNNDEMIRTTDSPLAAEASREKTFKKATLHMMQ